ncbi:MAG: hypothetical protein ABGZ17_05550 [Planctomycetaceae bacterium]
MLRQQACVGQFAARRGGDTLRWDFDSSGGRGDARRDKQTHTLFRDGEALYDP